MPVSLHSYGYFIFLHTSITSISCSSGSGSESVMYTMLHAVGIAFRITAPSDTKIVAYKPTIPTFPSELSPS